VKVEWSLTAVDDLDRIQDYIEQESPRGAKRVWTRIHERVGLQADTPDAAPFYKGGPTRMLVITGTPYLVFYTVEGDVLRVEYILHGTRDR
jgi:toxin ParE1/3/4